MVLKWALLEGEMQECCWMNYIYFVAAKKYFPIKADIRVAFEKNRLI